MMSLPTGFVPNEDQGYFFTVFNLPDGASMERTDQLMRRAESDLKTIPGVEEVLTMGGLNLLTNAYTSNNASIITMLKPREDRCFRRRRSTAWGTPRVSCSSCRTKWAAILRNSPM
jgi:HAE1 family hydrophobic/amphiphilic exporter-1/multidrug efflux pump